MQRIDDTGVVFYRFDGLLGQPTLNHALFTRCGGVSKPPFSSLNVGHTVGDDLAAVRANHDRALGALGWRRADVVTAYLVHGDRVAVVDENAKGAVFSETDALVTDTPGVVLMLRFADCVPVLFYDQRKRVIGLAHAGWRGVPAGIIPATVSMLVNVFGCELRDLWAGVGPSIGPCCYEVGPEVIAAVSAAVNGRNPFDSVNGRLYLDLWTAVQGQLADAGVGEVEVSGICTSCHIDEWFSHRAEKGKTGRFGVAFGLNG